MPKIIQINGKVNLIKNHVKIKTVSHCLVAAFFLFGLGIGREEGKDEALGRPYEVTFHANVCWIKTNR